MSTILQAFTQTVIPRMSVNQTLNLLDILYRIPLLTRKLSRCPVCGAVPDRTEFLTRFTPLDRCGTCDHVYSRKVPKALILHLMYRDIDYWERDKIHQGISKIGVGNHWNDFLSARAGALQRSGLMESGVRKIFEIGCSEGILLRHLQDSGHLAIGCECNLPTAYAGIKALGADIRIGLFGDLSLPLDHFDVVASFHTIEHIPDLAQTFAKIVAILKPEGGVLIEVPTGPDEYSNTDHVQFFSEKSLKTLLDRYFEFTDIVTNSYTTPERTIIGSLYGIGKHPKKSRQPIDGVRNT